MTEVEFIPGTALPIGETGAASSGEGRGLPRFREGRGKSLLEAIGDRDDIPVHELAVLDAALRAYDRMPPAEKPIFQSNSGESDATTGNLVLPLFTVPAGMYGQVTQVVADVPGSASINPSAPLANAAIWAFIASLSPLGMGGGPGAALLNANADNYRFGLLDFLPVSAGGPTIPGRWTYGDDNGPIVWGGEQLVYVLHGGSIAAAKSLQVQVTFRINLMSRNVRA